MTKAIESAPISEIEWKKLDNLYTSMESSMIDWCIAVSHLEDKQDEIGERYGIDHSNISMMVKIGDNADKFLHGKNLIKNLPSGYSVLYQMCDLSSTEIKKLCRDSTPTRAVLQARRAELGLVKKKVLAIKSAYLPDMEGRLSKNATNPYYILDLREDCSIETLKIITKYWKQKYHPDKGGDAEAFNRILAAEKSIYEKRNIQ